MAQYMMFVLVSLILAIVTIQLIRKRKLREEYALGWLGASFTILLLSLLGGLLAFLSPSFAVSYPATILLVLGLLAALLILLNQSVVLSTQANHIRDLAQSMAILEWRLRQYEKEQRTAVPSQTPAVAEENLYDPTHENSHHWPGRGHLRSHQTLGD